MKTLNIDIETYSDEDLTKVGVYKYADSPNFEILLFAYSVDDGPVECEDLTISEIPDDLVGALTDKNVLKIAFNAQFERVCLSKYLGVPYFLDPVQWRCTMVHANELGLPASLGQCAKYLNIEQQKDTRGTQLINFFSKPCKPTKKNGMRTRNLPEHDPEKWQTFTEYCIQDVNVEMAIADKLNRFPIPESEWELYTLDQRINDRGAEIDRELATAAIDIMEDLTEKNMEELKRVTGLDNPNSLKQLKGWLGAQGAPFETLGKDVVTLSVNSGNLPKNVEKALKIRLNLSNSSTKKYLMMNNASCRDGRIRGILQFYGANRTGRWAGRLLQVQNLPRNYLNEIEFARELVKEKDIEAIEWMYYSVPDTLKQLIRTGLVAKDGHRFIISDFSAIEARIIAWYANQEWVLDVFRTHGKIYEATATQMFHLGSVEDFNWKSNEGKDMRQRGKVATLALGYQGGPGALKAMGALEQGIKEDELQDIVDRWRDANKRIRSFWYDTQKAVIDCLQNGGIKKGPRGLKFFKKSGFLFIQLPSGRKLAYAKAHLEEGNYGPAVFYEGQGDKVVFTKQQTYGGKLVENIVQATARDILAEALIRLEKDGYPIVFHVHDEAVAEVPEGIHSIEEMNRIMSVVPEWAEGLPLSAEGFETKFYMKD
ncbi:DNA polymerase [Enterococcus mundtii]|uniref:DNA polymerase n=1 Tax=Enterococcus mundtii TaxID=53346 RepID=UPI00129D1B9C|nr:DNA polymerase [Enterococcus mundtii]MRI74083.1 DNA polymerase [Enterococcus mundtii]